MSGENLTQSAENATGSEEEGQETFHIYILSFSYGFLLLVILGHLVVRWQWRKVKGSKFPNHYPGDKSFKCKAIQQQLRADFATISKLAPDPLLINTSYDPEVYGPCKGGQAVPSHWYRLKACEAASRFVLANKKLLGNSDSLASTFVAPSQRHAMTLALPELVSRLGAQGVLQVDDEQGVFSKSCELYEKARYQDGEFLESHFTEFMEHLERIQQMLPPAANLDTSLRPGLDLDLSTSDPTLLRGFSLEPLLATSPSESSALPNRPPLTLKQPREKRIVKDQVLTPLIPASCPDSSYSMPETLL